MYIVEWCDHEGNQQQRTFDNLEEKFDYVAIIAEMEV